MECPASVAAGAAIDVSHLGALSFYVHAADVGGGSVVQIEITDDDSIDGSTVWYPLDSTVANADLVVGGYQIAARHARANVTAYTSGTPTVALVALLTSTAGG